MTAVIGNSACLSQESCNHQLPVYCSWKLDLGALALTVDAFPSHGLGKSLTCFLLSGLAEQALLKIHREAVNHACLVVLA